MRKTIRNRIALVNANVHYISANNATMDFKEWLKAEMERRNLTASALSRLAKVPQPTIFRILSGETADPRSGTVKRLQKALGANAWLPVQSPTEDDVVSEFAWTYNNVNDKGKEYLLKSIEAVKAGYLKDLESKKA